MSLEDLKHVEKKTPGGAEVYVLDTGSVIDSEGEAMLQALHSRSTGGIKHHLGVLEKRGSDNFMKNFYVGYGHRSIGDCGSTTIFIEGVSMLAAKAIQDNKLYSGQEASIRYIDFSKQRFINPLGSDEGKDILESQREFYLSILEPTRAALREQYPKPEGEEDKIYDKAINARAFDIARGFLPAGASTNLAWHSNLRQVSDRLLFLRHHPLEEVRGVAETIEDAVIEAHPNSFTKKRYPATENYQDLIAENYYYHDPNSPHLEIFSDVDKSLISKYSDLINNRPPKTELPKFLSYLGDVSAKFKLDFGSFRDIQRHRAIDQRMPLLTTDLDFNDWYLDNLSVDVWDGAINFLEGLELRLDDLDCSSEVKQYYTPMGYNTSNYINGDVPSMVYMTELRATRFVHPTLRKVARAIGEYINDNGIKVHFDSDPDRFDVRRGKQDISIK